MVMTGGDDDAAGIDKLPRPFLDDHPELVIKRLVYLVQQQDARFHFLRNCEPEPRTHSL
jgi:hypothetical protein